MRAWLYPGQGSQHRGMGAGLFERHPDLVAVADAVLGHSVTELCLEDPHDRLGDTRYAQPALFVVGVLSHLAMAEDEPPPDFLAGHSLGEYVALFAAGSFDFPTGVELVRRRGELMSLATGGGMVAVVGPTAGTVSSLLAEGGYDDVDIANHNAADQVVLSGPRSSLEALRREIRARGGRCVPLKTSGAFHSRAMRPAAEQFARHLAGVAVADPALPVLSNVTGLPYPPGSVRRLLAEQVHRPVQWARCMAHLLDSGVTEVAEVGPGTVLTGLWRSALRSARRPAPVGDAGGGGATAAARPAASTAEPRPEQLGSTAFRADYGLRYAYLAGSMYHGISSTDLVIRMGRAGLMGFFGAGGLRVERVDEALGEIQAALGRDGRYGANLLSTPDRPDAEEAVVDLYLRRGVRHVEAAAYTRITPALVRYRYAGAHVDRTGRPVAVNRVLAKVSRPEVAAAFLRPPPRAVVDRLVDQGRLTAAEAAVAASLPVSEDLCVEADSGGHTDGGVALALLPSVRRLADEVAGRGAVRVGAAGGLGTPEALAAVFLLGADFVVTGSINQCTPEAGTSEAVKDMLAALDVQDTGYAPAGDMFEAGARVQVVRKGTLFAVRANRLHQLYRGCGGVEEIEPGTRAVLERDVFGRPLDAVWAEVRDHLAARRPDELVRAERDPKRKLGLVLRWYFRHSTAVALRGVERERVNFQVHCGPAMGAFNRWVAGTDLEDRRRRHVDVVAERLMTATARYLRERLDAVAGGPLAERAPSPAVGVGPS
ncbi:trans-AT polyketide synthase/acyltransferase/oxidoreductase domain-containing protein [Saccharothrix coeruleofusca]|uniref:ACP S-malonyltransferase n=1 Tax=Saccharothrix coeruleofusca TaxID=33919 RepID=UPI001AE52134|nr:ACP S-malonyltransferase [Saccharothrix coeruleofusca]MBP2336632.1 trans-AT polyketide synthase/acyltransferase/oxidoreductase domain-containing protein [Saccharothrix coeruleofusca]